MYLSYAMITVRKIEEVCIMPLNGWMTYKRVNIHYKSIFSSNYLINNT